MQPLQGLQKPSRWEWHLQDILVSEGLTVGLTEPWEHMASRTLSPSLGTDPSLVLPFRAALAAVRRPAGRPAQLSVCSLFQALDLRQGRKQE